MRDFIMHAAHCFFCFYHLFVSFLFLLLFFNLISCPSTTPYGKKLPNPSTIQIGTSWGRERRDVKHGRMNAWMHTSASMSMAETEIG